MKRWLVGWVVCVLGSAQAASLADWVEQVAQTQPEWARVEAQQAWTQAQKQQGERWFPQGGYALLYYETDRFTGEQGLEQSEVGVGLSLWAWGQRQAQQAYADQTEQLTQLLPRLLRLDWAQRLREAAWQHQRSALLYAKAQEERVIWQTLLVGVKAAVAAGEKSLLEQQLAQQALLRAELAQQQAQAQYQQTQQYLALFGVEGEIDALLETPSRLSWQAHPALQWQQQRVAQARAARELAQTSVSGQPSMELTTKREQTHSAGVNASLVATLTLPFGRGQSLALAERLQEQTQEQVALSVLERERYQAWFSAQQGLEQARLQAEIMAKNRDISQQTLALARLAYQQGETALSELLRVQQQTLADERDAALAQWEVGYRIALFNQALGVLPQ